MSIEAYQPSLSPPWNLRHLRRQVSIIAAVSVAAFAASVGVTALIVRVPAPTARQIAQASAQRRAIPPLPSVSPETIFSNSSKAQLSPNLLPNPTPVGAGEAAAQDAAETTLAIASHLARPFAPSPSLAKPWTSPPPLASAPLPPPRPVQFASLANSPTGPFDRWTAVYDLTAHRLPARWSNAGGAFWPWRLARRSPSH